MPLQLWFRAIRLYRLKDASSESLNAALAELVSQGALSKLTVGSDTRKQTKLGFSVLLPEKVQMWGRISCHKPIGLHLC